MSSVPSEIIVVPPFTRRMLNFDCIPESADDDVSDIEESPREKVVTASPKKKCFAGPKPHWPSEVEVPVVTPKVVPTKDEEAKVDSVEKLVFGFENAQGCLDVEISRAWSGCAFRNRGKISCRDARVAGLPFLEMCPRMTNKKTCHCVELAMGATVAFQRDMRSFYCRVIQESSLETANQYLMSLMLPRRDCGNRCGLAFKIPGFIYDGRVRIFYVCGPQFRKLFGLSSKRFYRLVQNRQQNLRASKADHPKFGWSRTGDAYSFNGKRYEAFRSEYWIDYMLKHGGYDASDNLN